MNNVTTPYVFMATGSPATARKTGRADARTSTDTPSFAELLRRTGGDEEKPEVSAAREEAPDTDESCRADCSAKAESDTDKDDAAPVSKDDTASDGADGAKPAALAPAHPVDPANPLTAMISDVPPAVSVSSPDTEDSALPAANVQAVSAVSAQPAVSAAGSATAEEPVNAPFGTDPAFVSAKAVSASAEEFPAEEGPAEESPAVPLPAGGEKSAAASAQPATAVSASEEVPAVTTRAGASPAAGTAWEDGAKDSDEPATVRPVGSAPFLTANSAAQPVTEVPAAEAAPLTASTAEAGFSTQIADAVESHRAQGVSEFRMDIHPQELGRVSVRMTVENRVLTIEIAADNPHTQSLLASGAQDIRSLLENSSQQPVNILCSDRNPEPWQEAPQQQSSSERQSPQEGRPGQENRRDEGADEEISLDFRLALRAMEFSLQSARL